MDAEELLRALQGRQFSPLELNLLELRVRESEAANKQALLDALEKKFIESHPKKSGRAVMQDWTCFPAFLTASLWHALETKTDVEAMQQITQHLARMGLRNPTESTTAVMVALLRLQRPAEDMAKQHNYLITCKSHMQLSISVAPRTDYIVARLPADVQLADPRLRQLAEASEPVVAPRVSLMEVFLGYVLKICTCSCVCVVPFPCIPQAEPRQHCPPARKPSAGESCQERRENLCRTSLGHTDLAGRVDAAAAVAGRRSFVFAARPAGAAPSCKPAEVACPLRGAVVQSFGHQGC